MVHYIYGIINHKIAKGEYKIIIIHCVTMVNEIEVYVSWDTIPSTWTLLPMLQSYKVVVMIVTFFNFKSEFILFNTIG